MLSLSILVISILCNVIFVFIIIRVMQNKAKIESYLSDRIDSYIDEIAELRMNSDVIKAEYIELTEAITKSLREIRADIDRNYGYIHACEILDALAYLMKGGPVLLNDSLRNLIMRAGGEKYIANNKLFFSGALFFAWHLHANARKQINDAHVVEQKRFSHNERARWLSKTLSRYERMCGNKDDSIRSLEIVLAGWKCGQIAEAILYIETYPH